MIHVNSVLLCFELPAEVPQELLLPVCPTSLAAETLSFHRNNKKTC